jgi:acetolactate synthase I/II/III large subunit
MDKKVMRLNGAELTAEYIIAQGVPYVLGLTGHSLMPFNEALYQRKDRIKHIMLRHEHVATCMADGYFRATGKPLVVYLHMGPGLLNGINGIATAFADSVGMVVITGNTWQKHFGRNASQETSRYFDGDQCSLVRSVVKRSWQVQRADMLPDILKKAFKTATTGRPGPVHIDLPLSVQAEMVEIDQLPDPSQFQVEGKIRPDAEAVRKAVSLLLKAKNPVICCGSGAKSSGAAPGVLELAETLAAPVGFAHRGKGAIPEDHPLCIGLFGAEANPHTNKIISEADVILAVGMRFTEPDTSSWQPGSPFSIPPAKLIHIDIDPDEIAKYYPTAVGMWADAKSAIEEILPLVKVGLKGKVRNFKNSVRVKAYGKLKKEWLKSLDDKRNSNAVPIRPERLIKELRAALPREGVIFVDTGKVKNWAYQQLEAYGPDSYFIAIGWTPMGHAAAASLGIKLAQPKRPVVTLMGDGSFQQVPWSISTAVDYNLPITIIIFNDYAFGAVRDIQIGDYEGHTHCTDFQLDCSGELYNPDFVQIARGYGAEAERIEKPEDLGPAMKRAIRSGKTYVLDVVIDRDIKFPVAKQRAFRYLPKY